RSSSPSLEGSFHSMRCTGLPSGTKRARLLGRTCFISFAVFSDFLPHSAVRRPRARSSPAHEILPVARESRRQTPAGDDQSAASALLGSTREARRAGAYAA